MNEPVYCRTTINHLGVEIPVPVEVDIYDGRRSTRDFSWRENGFELQQLSSKVVDWADLNAIEAIHYDEITAWATQSTGCAGVLFFPALLRNPQAESESEDYAPIQLAHSDYTEGYAAMIKDRSHPYQQILSPSMQRAGISSDQLAQCSRVLTLQLWRSVGERLVDYPMAFCDSGSVSRQQLVPLRVEQYGGVDTQFDAFGLLPPPPGTENRWYTFPAMTNDEIVVFRAFDSDRAAHKLPFWTPHCAFHDRTEGTSPRHSVEMRAICLFW